MCNLYETELALWEVANLKLHYELIGKDFQEAMRTHNGPPSSIYPNFEAPVMVAREGGRSIERMRWGFPPPPFVRTKATVQNVRHLAKGYWRPYLGRENRCVVPATAFSEWDAALGRPAWFRRADDKPFAFAGVWRNWSGDRGTKAKPLVGDHVLFAFLTTEPNAVVRPVHEKAMPVLLLDQAAIEQWLTGDDAEALALQRPTDDAAIVRVLDEGPPTKKKAA